MFSIDKYAYASHLAGTDAMEKFMFSLVTLTVCIASDSAAIGLATAVIMACAVILAGHTPAGFYFKLLLVPAAFIAISTLTIAVNAVANTADSYPVFRAFGHTFGFTRESLAFSGRLFFKTFGAVSCMYFLSLTTPMIEVVSVLRRLKLPPLFIELMSLVYRFIFVLADTAGSIITTQTSRLGYSGLRQGFRSTAALFGSLFLCSYKRSRDLFTALEARCYIGELRVLEERVGHSPRTIRLMAAADGILALAAIIIGGRL